LRETAKYWIEKLSLSKHPEGGFFRETYRSDEVINKKCLPNRYTSYRSFSTLIYYLLDSNGFSAFHKLKSDETWHYYTGTPLTLFIIEKSGLLRKITLGSNPDKGEVFQFVVKKDNWFAATVNKSDSFSLIGCTVSPGFDFEDFEIGKRSQLIILYPEHSSIIHKLTHPE